MAVAADNRRAEVACSRLREAIGFRAYREESTSPCSVIFTPPSTVSGGLAWMLRFNGPPPRPRAPPRPWKYFTLIPFSRANRLGEADARTSSHWAFGSPPPYFLSHSPP